jgi:hypothetical protein
MVIILTPASGATYPKSVQRTFLKECEGGPVTVSECDCALEWFEKHVSLSGFMSDDQATVNGAIPSDIIAAFRRCVGHPLPGAIRVSWHHRVSAVHAAGDSPG